MNSNYSVPRGTYDILPQDSFKWDYMKKKFRLNAKCFNYREIITPIFENANLFERSVGDTSDIVSKEMYVFNDRKNRRFALRPEGTAPVVRSFIENNLDRISNPTRLYYLGPMFRYDRPQAGRYRQFYQYGVEAIGSDDPFIDAEVINVAYNFLLNIGLHNYQLEINSIGCPKCSQDYDKALLNFFGKHKAVLCPDCNNRLVKNPKRILDCKNKDCKSLIKESPSILDHLDQDCKNHFEKVKQYLQDLQIPYVINDRIVRGLDYYTNTAFEIINNNLGSQNALIGGGRYNNLIKQIGGKDTPAIGFAGGFERLLLSLTNDNVEINDHSNADCFFINMSDKAKDLSYNLIQKLRINNLSVIFENSNKSLKSQLKNASKSKVNYTIIMGEEEFNSKTVSVKNMLNGEQHNVKTNHLLNFLMTNISNSIKN